MRENKREKNTVLKRKKRASLLGQKSLFKKQTNYYLLCTFAPQRVAFRSFCVFIELQARFGADGCPIHIYLYYDVGHRGLPIELPRLGLSRSVSEQ